ncbi:MAG: efflux RND transporter periplasmic adaptor subunit [Chlamydiales bacterium]|nr:efflux RND transporter periplasmic adaptor subunit [Chlamydiales bacterium]
MRRIILASLLCIGCLNAAESPVSALVVTEPLVKKSLTHTIVVYGTVEVASTGISNINFKRSGRIAKLYVVPGQRVSKGEPLVKFEVDPNDLASYYQDKIAADLAEQDLERTEKLLKLKLATQAQYATAQKTLMDAQARVQVNEGIGSNEPTMRIKAPCDGLVISVTGSQGDFVAPGTNVLQFACNGDLQARLQIEPGIDIEEGMAVKLTSLFNANDSVEATVTSVSGRINPDSRLIDVVVALPNHWLPGLRVRGTIELSHKEGWAVNETAVLEDQEGTYIFQAIDGIATRVSVREGITDKDEVLISGAFDVDKPVVVLGNYELANGMHLRERR